MLIVFIQVSRKMKVPRNDGTLHVIEWKGIKSIEMKKSSAKHKSPIQRSSPKDKEPQC